MASVALDTESAGQNIGSGSGATSCSWTHTPSGSPNIVYVVASYAAASSVTASATYDGVAMTEISNSPITLSFEGLTQKISVFRLKAPPAGAKTVVVSFTATSFGACGSSGWLNVDQTTPEGTVGNANGNLASGQPTGAAITVPANGAGFGALCRSYNGGATTPVPNKTELFTTLGTGNWVGGAQYTLSTGSQTISWTNAGTAYWGVITFPINAAAAVPVNTVAPAVTGTAQVGQTLTTDNGTWTNTPTSYAYLWKHGDGSAAGGTATNSTYVPVAGDVGFPMQCFVTASNADGPGSAAGSNATSAVLPPAPTISVAPVVTPSSGVVGATFSCTTGTWNNTPTSYSYQWKLNGSNIGGATSSTYVSAAAGSLTCEVTAANAGGSSTPAISTTVTVSSPPPAPPPPSVGNTPRPFGLGIGIGL